MSHHYRPPVNNVSIHSDDTLINRTAFAVVTTMAAAEAAAEAAAAAAPAAAASVSISFYFQFNFIFKLRLIFEVVVSSVAKTNEKVPIDIKNENEK